MRTGFNPLSGFFPNSAFGKSILFELVTLAAIFASLVFSVRYGQSATVVKLAQIALTVFATATTLKIGKRCTVCWKLDRTPEHIWLASVLWALWLSATVSCLAATGQNMLWDFSRPALWLNANVINTTKTGSDSGGWFDAISIIVAIVTGGFLMILHHSLDQAKNVVKEIEELRQRLPELERLIVKEQQNSLSDIGEIEYSLRVDVIRPLLSAVSSPTVPARVQELLQTIQRRVSAEICLFNINRAVDLDEFIRNWSEIDAFMDIYQQDPEKFLTHFVRAESSLALLSKRERKQAETPEILKIRKELRKWLRKCGQA